MSTEMQVWNPEKISLIQRTIAPTVSRDEFDLFIARCKQTGLDPIARQIYAISRYDRQVVGNKMTIQVSIDGMRLLAERSGKYAGQLGPLFCGKDGKEWCEVWTSNEPPYAAKVGILRSDFQQPLWSVAKYSEYVQTYKDGNPSSLWAKMPDLMLAKCAESLALRRAFPYETSGLYTREEMMQADIEPVEAVPTVEGRVTIREEKSNDAPATEQQLASIRKLNQHLGKPEFENEQQIGYLEAKAMIETLSKEYREMREKQPTVLKNGDGTPVVVGKQQQAHTLEEVRTFFDRYFKPDRWTGFKQMVLKTPVEDEGLSDNELFQLWTKLDSIDEDAKRRKAAEPVTSGKE